MNETENARQERPPRGRRTQVHRRRAVGLFLLVVLVGLVALVTVGALGSDGEPTEATVTSTTAAEGGGTIGAGEDAAGATAAGESAPDDEPAPPRKPSDRGKLKLRETIAGAISPKSVVASGTGLFFAQNMMYQHTVTVYDRDDEARRDDPGHRGPGRSRPSEVRGLDASGRAGRGRLHARRRVRVRVELLHVRSGVRPRRQRRLQPRPVRRQLRLPDRHEVARDRPGDPGRGGARNTSR